MKLFRVVVGVVALFVATSSQAGMGKWDAVYGFDREIGAAFDHRHWFGVDSPVLMMGWLTMSPAAAAEGESRSALTPVAGARLSHLKRYFVLHTDLAVSAAQAAQLASWLTNSAEFKDKIPNFLKTSKGPSICPWSCKTLPGLAQLADTMGVQGAQMGSWRFSVDRTVVRGKLTYIFDIRLIIEIPDTKEQTALRDGLRGTLLGEVDTIDPKTFNPVLDRLIEFVNKTPGLYPGAEAVLRLAFRYPAR